MVNYRISIVSYLYSFSSIGATKLLWLSSLFVEDKNLDDYQEK